MTSGYQRPQKRASEAVNYQLCDSCAVFKLCGVSERTLGALCPWSSSLLHDGPPMPAPGLGGCCSRNGLRELSALCFYSTS